MTLQERIKIEIEKDPALATRSMRYVLASRITDVEPEICKMICSLVDIYRHIGEADETGKKLERDWIGSAGLANWTDEAKAAYKQTNLL